MSEVLNVAVRQQQGTRASRRLRRQGQVPAVLYGHGEQNVNLSVPADQLESAIRHGHKLVDLRGDVAETALIRDVQWDTFGADLLHVDLARVSATELVEVAVAVELRGEAPGAKAGGLVEHLLHEVEIECPARSIPDKFEVSVNSLGLGQSFAASELRLPEGARLITAPEAIIVHCVETAPEKEEEVEAGEALEPEIISRRAEEGDESEE